jgi:iron(III) transport system ATP-binding protein
VTHDQAEALAMSDIVVVMNQGKIEQIGAPADIYDHPRTSFVADFIGSANLVAVTASSQAGDGTVLARTAVGEISCGRTAPGQARERSDGGFVCVRPEDVEVRSAPAAGEVRDTEFAGVVESAEFLGDRLEVIVRAADIRLTAVVRAGSGLRKGDPVGVRLDPASTSYLPS